ncbi:hypothetical protein EMIT048CA2_170017 [Pseudomonas chlororaphis]
MGRVVRDHHVLAVLGQADDLVGIGGHAVHFHAGRTHGHAGGGDAEQVVAFAQGQHLVGRHMAFDEFAVDHRGVAGRQARGHAQALLDFAHIAFDMVVDLEAVGLQVLDPFLAAAAVGVAVHIDGDQVGGLGQGADEQGRQGCQAQSVVHRESLDHQGASGARSWADRVAYFATFLERGAALVFQRYTKRLSSGRRGLSGAARYRSSRASLAPTQACAFSVGARLAHDGGAAVCLALCVIVYREQASLLHKHVHSL